MQSIVYSILSLGFGFLAWGLGIAAICKKGCPWCVFGSFTMCGISLVLQFYEISWRVTISDFAAIEDTIFVLADVAAFLLMVTVVLNGIALLRGRNRE